MRVLLVEDNEPLSEAIAESLANAGFAVDRVARGEDALSVTADQQYDALVLDLGLPDMDGMDVLKALREKKNAVPVLMLTARDALSDKIDGLNRGADDYMVKPFETDELIARLKALLRRPAETLSEIIKVGNLNFDTTNRQARAGEKILELSKRETDLLEHLLRSLGKIVPKKSIEMRLYSYDDKGSVNSVEVLVHRLRKKLQNYDAGIDIHTLRGIGYMIMEPDNEPPPA
ncbi:MAG TPA: response regulator transcription factor [Patescibacteria group bacterium]|nr:response regulator transcription factor [Patescibacteria group bacterium]